MGRLCEERKIEIELAIFEDERAIDFISDSEWDWQEKKKIKFIGKNKAEGIERVIWFCPKCQTFKSIKAKGDKVYKVNRFLTREGHKEMTRYPPQVSSKISLLR